MTLPRRRTRVALLAAALTLLAAPVATAGSAHGATWTHRDAQGDVVRIASGDSDADASVGVVADDATDITRFTVKHRARKVVVSVHLRDLQRGDNALVGRVVTPHAKYSVLIMRSSDMRMFTLSEVSGREDSAVSCRGKRQSFDIRRNTITVTIPRTCLGDPTWVRAGAAFIRGSLMAVEDDAAITVDDALRTGNKRSVLRFASPKVGRKVRAG
ncbi:hypothetical protein [Nocardioides lianchengensis]|uniref:DUF5666 domain-containing protein n=1 Tax=Nocardioides lianchengensis TaxID=1045774 RepID=A0A1G6I6Q3_9ACTN|nr:hypothetical protein [Nocardioides lianchengensis]NYG13148.1 hypothetical protein [Nocardioides lianchengensis]SDC02217.1 hypothetical protein SAMN05421872_10178 [Nocardioides lianchengensis]